MMGEHIIVSLVALVCLVTTSTCQNKSYGPCMLLDKGVSTLVEKKQETDVLQTSVFCDLTSQESGVKLTFDINWALDAAEVDNNTLVMVYVAFWCLSSTELHFTNPRNTANKNILLGLYFVNGCKVWTRNLSVFAKATYFCQMVMGDKVTWSSASSFTNVTQGNDSFLNDLRVVMFLNNLPENIHGLFNDTKIVFPNMTEIIITRTPIKEIPEQWKITVPFLQVLSLIECNLTEPPEYPWNNSALDRAEVRDTYEYYDAYQVQSHLYPRILYLDKNNIEDLTSHEFRGFLHYLSLRENGLKAIGPSCFHNLEGIETIDLGENNLASLHRNLFQGLTSLLKIILGSNNLTIIERTLFKGLNNIKRIELDNNKLHSIPNGLFNSLRTLELLSLSGNNIEKIEENPFPKYSALQNLYLDKNKLSSLPPWIFSLRKIKSIDLSSNQLTLGDLDKAVDDLYVIPMGDPLKGRKSSEIVLNLSNNNITTVDYKGLSRIKRNEGISVLQELKYSYLWRTYKIDLSGNPLVCDCIMSAFVQKIRKLFLTHSSMRSRFHTWRCHRPLELKDKPILEIREDQWLGTELDDRNCPTECTCRERCSSGIGIIVDCAGKSLTEVPSSMPQGLIELNLINNDIRDITERPYFANVTVLKLTNNKVERLNASTMKELKRLKILLLDSNELTTLPKEIKSLNFTTLALDQNFFKCDCTTKWIKHWLVQLKNKRRIESIKKVFCNSGHAIGQAIYSVPDDEFICAPIQKKNAGKTVRTELTIAACSLGGLLALILFVGIVLYKYHREVKVFMYTHFNWHPYDRIDDSDPNKIYDAFLSFSGDDFDWVVNTLQERLENHDPPYKLCLHHRDFPIGEPIVENIFKSVDQSKRMLVVLSSSYAKSDWCLMEFREAHRKVLEDRMKYLIVILFDDVDTTELDEEFKLYLRTNTYLSVSDKRFWQKLFYAMPLPSARESVDGRSLESIVAASNYIYNSAELLQQEEIEMAQSTGGTA